ncbi:hypothetical protein D9611_004164 [Ephemerocybe angulata]|uniref:Mitochondrial adapter protein MCP1 transmembrane domain-containing protein n=1 Tax=Ephemerocybe angulata TaxID=980116 RepID=A0A8H5F5Q6_9AGAR|nr:hypothetical protein D9611_004164 [Tulosesus angulatus]
MSRKLSVLLSTQLLGREYYQTPFAEKALVLGPITAHIVSATLKRLLSSKPSTEPRRWRSPLSVTGYAVALLYLPVHYLTHRVHPAQEAAPILAVGPSELDFEFVKHGLQTWPVRSWLIYGGLTMLTVFHMSFGAGIIWNRWMKPLLPTVSIGSTKTRNRLVFGGLALPALTGLYFMSKEPVLTFSSTLTRYTASYLTSSIYRL